MPPRQYVDGPLARAERWTLPPAAARHVQVLRLQPGSALTLFDGRGGEWRARIVTMGRGRVEVQVDEYLAIERELPRAVTLAVGMPANERMDALVEKATELGVAAIQPLMTQHSVLRLDDSRAAKRLAHWRAVTIAACEQCGRNRLPILHPVARFATWLGEDAPVDGARVLLSLADQAQTWSAWRPEAGSSVTVLSGPEGGLSAEEEALALARGWRRLHLGSRILRADTAPLAALASLAIDGG